MKTGEYRNQSWQGVRLDGVWLLRLFSLKAFFKAVVVAQLVERSFPIPKVHGSNPVICNKLYWTFTLDYIEKTKTKKKRPGMAHF